MTKERLSKLQKWILNRAIESYKKDIEEFGNEGIFGLKSKPHISRKEIYVNFFNWKGDVKKITSKYRSTVSRSLKRLRERGLVDCGSFKNSHIFLTDKAFKT